MRKLLLIFVILLFFVPAYITAQIIPFQNYFTVQNGLPSNTIYDIEQDQLGYLWFATQAGAVKFDGYNYKTYSSEDGIPDNNIIDIHIDSNNSIWLATESGGLAVLKKDKIRVINQDNGLVSNESVRVFEDHKGNIWYTSYGGISIINADTIINYDSENSQLADEIITQYVAKDGTVWISTRGHLYYINNELHTCKNPFLDKVTVRAICEDKPGSYWFASEGKGVIHVEKGETYAFTRQNGLCSNIVTSLSPVSADTVIVSCKSPGGIYKISGNRIIQKWDDDIKSYVIQQILIDKRNRIWGSTPEDGLLLIENGILNKINETNSLSNNRIQKIYEDRNGNIWIATANGLSKYGKIIFQIFKEDFIMNDLNIQSIASAGRSVYIGTYGGLNIINKNQLIRNKTVLSDLPPNVNILSILPLDEKKIWLGTDKGLTLYLDQQFINYPFSISFKSNNSPGWVTDLKMINNEIYCATARGLVKFSNDRYELFEMENEMADANTWSIEIDNRQNIWCATVNGLAIFNGNEFHYYDTTQGLSHHYCNDIAFDREGYAWIATDKGLSRVELHKDWSITCMNFDKSKGMGSDIIFSVLVDKTGYIWAGHNFGLDRIDPINYRINHYGPLEGFLPVETSLGASTLTSGDDLWFGTVGGAVRYIHDNDYVYTDPPLLYIADIKFYEDSTSILKYAQGIDSLTKLPVKLSLPYFKNNLVFSYVGIHYTIIEKNQYKYILEGYDDEWSVPTNSIETPPYRKIPPGNYTFKILAANCDGVWSGKPAEFYFEIRPPFYKTWWFIVIEILAGIGTLLAIMWLRVRKLKHDKLVLTQKVKERTIEIEKQRDQIALQKKEITDSIIYAERIQIAALPDEEYIGSLLNDYFILFKPRNIVSGDFYWINRVGDKTIVIAADCTGHGVPGAFMSMLGITTLNEVVSSKNSTKAGEILDTLRFHLTKTLKQTGKEEDAKDGMDIALCIFDFDKMKLQYSGAYNPLIHVRNKEIITYKADKMPVGIHYGEVQPFTTYDIDLLKGDCLYIFSDGYADQFGGPEGKKFKSAHFNEVLLEINDLPMKEQKIRLDKTITDWMGINEQVDDILIIGLRA